MIFRGLRRTAELAATPSARPVNRAVAAPGELPVWWHGAAGPIASSFRSVTEVYELDGETLGRLGRFIASADAAERIAAEIARHVASLPSNHPAARVYGALGRSEIAAEIAELFCGRLDDALIGYLDARLTNHINRSDDLAVAFPYVTLAPAVVGRLAEELHLPGAAIGQLARGAQRLALCVAMMSMRRYAEIRDRQLVSMEKLSLDAAELSRVGADLRQLASLDNPVGLGAAVGQASMSLAGLGDLAGQVGSVVGIISGLAGQTRLLALNAAIEASHAGEEGNGFRVVASEVKSLAASTEESLATVKSLTERIRAGIDEAASCMELVDQAATRVEHSAEVVSALSEGLTAPTG